MGDSPPPSEPGEQTLETGQTGDSSTEQDPLNSLPLDNIIFYLYNNGLSLVSQYGWYILLTVIVLVVVWSRFKSQFYQWWKKRQDFVDERNYDPVKAERYQDAMYKAREKMQRELNEKAAQALANKEKNDSETRDDRIKQWEEFKVVSTTKRSKPRDRGFKPPPRRDYFPMDSGGGSGGYRPSRRTGRGG